MDDIRRSLIATPASVIVERLADHLAERYAATEVELLLVDYRLSALLPLLSGDLEAPDAATCARLGATTGGAGWQSFDHQAPVSDGAAVFVPVTVRGERLGVLRVAPSTLESHATELCALGSLLAHEMAAARITTDRYVMAARAQRLTLAAELQWETLPGRSCESAEFTLAGQLEPV